MGLKKRILAWLRSAGVIYAEYTALSLAVLLPLVKPGYILLLDMIATPKVRMPAEVSSGYPYVMLLYLLNLVVSTQVMEKVLFLGVLVFAFVGMHRLVKTRSEWPRYFAAILYVFNPFVYSRFIFGHIGLLLAYAVTPFLVRHILDFMEGPDLKKAVRVAVLATLMAVFSVHHIVFAALIGGIALAVFASFTLGDRRKILKTVAFTLLIILIFLLLNSFWLVSFFKGGLSQAQVMAGFGREQILGFQTVADQKLGVLFNTAAMYGFWGDQDARYILQKNIIPGWDLIFVVLFAIAAWGLFVGIRSREQRWRTVTIGLVGLVSFVLAVGVAHAWSAPISWFLDKYVPLFKGFRDSQKFVALLCLTYAYLGALGVERALDTVKRLKKVPSWLVALAPALFLILPLLYSPLMLWGFGGQIRPVDYPRDWYQVNEMLNKEPGEFRVLFLPWHQYMGFSFAGRVIANPAHDFFDRPVIQGDNIEFGKIYRQTSNPTSDYIEKNVIQPILQPKEGTTVSDIGKRLKPLRIKYVILAKDADYGKYLFLDTQKDLRLVRDSANLTVYLNKEFR